MSATIIPFLHGSSFDPAQVQAMGEAFDKVRKALHDRGQPHAVLEIMAKRIIQIAETGECDPDKICERTLLAFGIVER